MDAGELRPLGVGEVLDVAIKIYRARFASLVKAVAVVVGPVSLLVALVQVSSFPEDGNELFTTPADVPAEPELDFADFPTFLGGLLVVTVLSLIASQLATAASLKIVSGAYLDEEPGWTESLRFATSRLRSLVWLSMVLGFFLVLGFLACVIPGIYLWGAWAVATPVLLLEDVRGRRALKRSRALVKGRWWPTAVVLLLTFILVTIVQMVSSGLVGAVASGANEVVNAVAQAVGNTAASVLATPFSAAVIVTVYFDLRVRKEGFDLELLARRVGIEAAPGSGPGRGPGVLPPPPPPPPSGSEPPFWPPPPGWRPPDG
ncbi:MAG: hypothetical protein M3N68_13660 [Actinomycetota bacterium]|nr:hypothetical protein [Actinomycetota bacterium]